MGLEWGKHVFTPSPLDRVFSASLIERFVYYMQLYGEVQHCQLKAEINGEKAL